MKRVLKFGPLFVVIAALIWSFDGLLRQSLYTLPPAVIVFYEHFLGSIVLLFFFKTWLPDVKKLKKSEWVAIALVSLFSGLLGTLFYTAALGQVHYIQYSVVVLLQQLQPIWAISAAAIVLKEKLTPKFLLWAALAIISAYFISFKDLSVNLSSGSGTVMAAGLALGAGMLWGSSTALSKKVLNNVSFITVTSLRFLLTTIFAFILVLIMRQNSLLSSLSTVQFLTLLTITFSTGMVALGIYYYGLKRTPASITTLCELVWPASSVFIDYFYFHHTFSLTQIFGIIVLLICIYQITTNQRKLVQ